LRAHGVREERIPEVLTLIRVFSDEKADPAHPPAAPEPADPGSPEDARTIEAARKFSAEKAELESKCVDACVTGKVAMLNNKRTIFWVLEKKCIRDLPRASHVGRALHEKGAVREGKAVGYFAVYEHLADATPSPLPIGLSEAVNRLRGGPINPAKPAGPKESKAASSMLTKNIDVRRKLLEELDWLKPTQTSRGVLTRLTAFGRKVFKDWPQWGSS
jgi:hypothetical protein